MKKPKKDPGPPPRGLFEAQRLMSGAAEAAPGRELYLAEIAALQIAKDGGGRICPNIRPVGEACERLSSPRFQHRDDLMSRIGENMFELTELGALAESYIPRPEREQSRKAPAEKV